MILLMEEEQKKRETKYTGLRLPVSLRERLEAVARVQKTSVRAVFEQIADANLPALERLYGIAPPIQSKPKKRKSGGG